MPNDVGMLSSIREIRPLEIIIIKQTTFKHRWPLTQRSLALRVLSLDHVSYAASLIITWEARGGSLRGTLVQFDIYEAIFQPYTPQPNALIYRTRSRERRLPPPFFLPFSFSFRRQDFPNRACVFACEKRWYNRYLLSHNRKVKCDFACIAAHRRDLWTMFRVSQTIPAEVHARI